MRFEKTTGDLTIVNSISPREIGLYEVFNIMLDLLLDVRNETGRELNSIKVSEQAVAKWIAVVNALLSVPVEAGKVNMTRRRSERLEQLQKDLKRKAESVSQTEKEITSLLEEEQQLEQKLNSYREEHEKLSALKQKKERYEGEIRQLKADIEAIDKIDYEVIAERRNQLIKTKADKEKRLQAFNEYNEQLDVLLRELEQTNSSIAAVNHRIAETEKQNNAAQSELQKSLLLIEQKQQEQQTAMEELAAETGKQELLLRQKTEAVQAKQEELQSVLEKTEAQEAEIGSLNQKIEQARNNLSEQLKTIEAAKVKIKQSEEETAAVTAEKENAQKELQKRNEEIRKLKWETEELSERNAAFQQKQEELQSEKEQLDRTVAECCESINRSNAELARMRNEMQQREETLRETESEMEIADNQLRKAEQEEERIRNEMEALRKELIAVNNRIVEAKTEESEFKAKLAVQKDELSQTIESKGAAIKQLDSEIARQKEQLNGLEEVSEALECEKAEAVRRYSDKQERLTVLHGEISKLSADTEKLQQEKERCEKEKKRSEERLTELNHDIRCYKDFFNSEQCRKTQYEINRLERVARLYQEGIKRLFNGMSPPVEHLGNLQLYFVEKRNKLNGQLFAVRNGLDHLSKDYLDLIAEIEKEVNG